MNTDEQLAWDKASELERRGVFLGGPKHKFVSVGRGQLEILLAHGLTADSCVLDVGCGSLRGGWWLINYLNAGRYFGIEPNTPVLDAGIEVMLGPVRVAEKRPSFSSTANFDFSVFGETFDFVIARSIWTHAARDHIRAMLASFQRCSTQEAVFLTSIVPPRQGDEEYTGTTWFGVSHESNVRGIAHYTVETISGLCEEAGLCADALEISDGQLWMKISCDRPHRQR